MLRFTYRCFFEVSLAFEMTQQYHYRGRISKATLKVNGQGGSVKIELYDMQGRMMKSVYEGNLTLATHHLPVDLDGLENGTYSIKIQQPNGIEAVQLVKMRD